LSGAGRHECLFESIAVLVTAITVAGLTEVLEIFALAAPAVTVFVILPGVLAIERLAASDASHLLARVASP
jgi:hypothetical protein